MINCFGPGVEHLNYLAVPGVGIFEFFSNQIISWGGNFAIFDLTFLPGGREVDINFLENVKIRPMIGNNNNNSIYFYSANSTVQFSNALYNVKIIS